MYFVDADSPKTYVSGHYPKVELMSITKPRELYLVVTEGRILGKGSTARAAWADAHWAVLRENKSRKRVRQE